MDFKNFVALSLQNFDEILNQNFDFENDNFSEFQKFDSLQFRGFKNFDFKIFDFKIFEAFKNRMGISRWQKFRESVLRSVSYQSLFVNLSNHTANVASFIFEKFPKKFKKIVSKIGQF